MLLLKPDPTFYPSPRLAMQAPPEKHAFVAALNPPGSKLNDALLVVDVEREPEGRRPCQRHTRVRHQHGVVLRGGHRHVRDSAAHHGQRRE